MSSMIWRIAGGGMLWMSVALAPASAQNVVNYRDVADPLLFLLREPAVHAELNLDKEQRAKLTQLNQSQDPALLSSRNRPPDESKAAVEKVLSTTRSQLQSLLRPQQRTRLSQIRYRLRGISFVLLPEIAAKLELRDSQRERLGTIIESGNVELAELRSHLQEGKLSQEQANRENTEIQQRQQRQVLKQLTDEQRRELVRLIGPPFDLTQLGHVTFQAPELKGPGPWINSEPLKLADLRGQVVAVHFWAFQCHNCINNFPWYRQWYQAYGDDGLVIVGVHTPETSHERQVDALRQQVKQERFTFPVLVDNQYQTWNAWGNSIWPAVYLIDKQGRLRYWWYGELNWQGAGGQEIMARKIEQLLAETD